MRKTSERQSFQSSVRWIVYKKTDEWCIEWQRVVQRVTTSGTTSDNEWQRVTTSGTTNDNEWQRVTISANFSFFQIREEPTTKHRKENSLNLEEDLWRRPIELRAEASTQKEILTVRSSCSQIFTKIVFLKFFAIFSF